MKVTQLDSRTIGVVADSGVRFLLPYRLSWNGHEREPASVVLETTGSGTKAAADIKAFFLFGMVRDRITSDAAGIIIARSWSMMTPGSVKLLLDVEFENVDDPVCLFPGVCVARGFPKSPLSFLGERPSYPAAVVVSLGREAAIVFSRSAMCSGDPSSIGISTAEREDEPNRLRVEVRFPGIEEPSSRTGPKPDDAAEPEDAAIQCSGSLERRHELFLAFSPRERILTAAPGIVVKRLFEAASGRASPRSASGRSVLAQAAQDVLATHLVEEGGVEGLREVPQSKWLSSSAGLELAVVLRRLFPGDAKTGETALRLADFSLKGQLPSGLFYESFDLDAGKWRGMRGRPAGNEISIAQSALIADILLLLAEDLEKEELPFEKYFLAGQRFVDHLVDDKGHLALEDSDEWELFFPLARVLDRLGRDRYKRALDALARRFAAIRWDIFQPPSSRAGRDSDSAASLLAVRLFVEMRRRGYRPAEQPGSGASTARGRAAESTRLFASLLVPWIRVQGDRDQREGQPRLDGSLVDSFVRQRLLFPGNEAAYLLQKLAAIAGEPDFTSLLGSLSRLCVASGRDVPLGTAFFQHTHWDPKGASATGKEKMGPVDSRRLSRELLYGLLLEAVRTTTPATKRARVPVRRPR